MSLNFTQKLSSMTKIETVSNLKSHRYSSKESIKKRMLFIAENCLQLSLCLLVSEIKPYGNLQCDLIMDHCSLFRLPITY